MSMAFERIKALPRAARSGLAVMATTGLLFGLTAGTAATAVYANGVEAIAGTCTSQPPANGDGSTLSGTLQLLDGALVGLDTRVSMAGATLQVPNPQCEGQYINVPLKYAWSITGRPTGSKAALTQTTTLTPHLTPDKVGPWQVKFTACPSFCTLASPNIRIAPISRLLNFNAVQGVEGRISSNTMDSDLKLLLAGSRVQISQTGSGQTVAGLQSYVEFGPTAQQNGAPSAPLPLAFDPPVVDVPDSVQGVLLTSQGALGILDGTDIDQIRVRANNVHLDLSNLGQWSASVANGGVNLGVSFASEHPTIKCEAHYTVKSFFLIPLAEGWSDDLCPDFDLSQMNLAVTLYPTVVNGQIALASNQVSSHFVSATDVKTELVDVFTGATDDLETGASTKLHSALDDATVKAGLGVLLNGEVKHRFSDLGPIISTHMDGTDWVIRYQSTAAQTTCAPACTGTATN
jgi:hypothetical protein